MEGKKGKTEGKRKKKILRHKKTGNPKMNSSLRVKGTRAATKGGRQGHEARAQGCVHGRKEK